MHDAAHLAHALLREDGQRVRVRIPAVHDHRLARPPCEVEHPAQHALLGVARRQVAEEVEPDLADGDDPRLLRQALDLREHGLVRVRGVVRVHAHRGPHVGLAAGDVDGGLRRWHVGADGEHAPHARLPGAREHRVAIGVEVGKVQVRVRVEQVHLDDPEAQAPDELARARHHVHRPAPLRPLWKPGLA